MIVTSNNLFQRKGGFRFWLHRAYESHDWKSVFFSQRDCNTRKREAWEFGGNLQRTATSSQQRANSSCSWIHHGWNLNQSSILGFQSTSYSFLLSSRISREIIRWPWKHFWRTSPTLFQTGSPNNWLGELTGGHRLTRNLPVNEISSCWKGSLKDDRCSEWISHTGWGWQPTLNGWRSPVSLYVSRWWSLVRNNRIFCHF